MLAGLACLLAVRLAGLARLPWLAWWLGGQLGGLFGGLLCVWLCGQVASWVGGWVALPAGCLACLRPRLPLFFVGFFAKEKKNSLCFGSS